MADVPPQGPVTPSVQALLDALDARSRAQAEDAAGRLLGHALDRVGEGLASIEQRLGALEQRGDNGAVFTQIVELGARLERFEQAFLRAVSDGGDGNDVVRKLEAVVRNGTGDYVRALESLRERQQTELGELRTTLEEVVRVEVQAAAAAAAATAPADPVDLAPLIVRLDEVSAKIQRPSTDAMRELAERLEAQVDRLHESFPRLNELRQSWAEEFRPVAERLEAVEEAVKRTSDIPADLPEVADRLAGAAERLAGIEHQLRERDEALGQLSGRMEGLESRVRTHLAGLTERVEGVMGAITSSTAKADPSEQLGELTGGINQLERAITDLRERAERSEQAGASDRSTLEQLQQELRSGPTLDAIAARVEEVLVAQPAPIFPEPPAPPQVPSADDTAAKVRDLLHRDFELLTQRVAALSVALDATRTLLDQHVEDTEQSLGRRATEVGRKLAADLGFRPKRDDRRDPRELNRGGH